MNYNVLILSCYMAIVITIFYLVSSNPEEKEKENKKK